MEDGWMHAIGAFRGFAPQRTVCNVAQQGIEVVQAGSAGEEQELYKPYNTESFSLTDSVD